MKFIFPSLFCVCVRERCLSHVCYRAEASGCYQRYLCTQSTFFLLRKFLADFSLASKFSPEILSVPCHALRL